MVFDCGGGGSATPQELLGRITTPEGSSMPGITVTLSGTGTGTAPSCSGPTGYSDSTTTDSNGNYSFSGDLSALTSGQGTVRPTYSGITFVPTSIQVNSSSPSSGLDFVAYLIFTLPPESLTNTSAVLVGRATPFGEQTTVYFQWSTNPSFNSFNTTTSHDLGNDYQAHLIKEKIGNLTPSHTYYYRLVSQNSSGGNTFGNIENFTTGTAPTVVTGQAQDIKIHSAVLNGSFIADGLYAWASFQWSTDPDLSNPLSTPILASGSSTTSIPFDYYLDALAGNTTYYYRAVAANSGTTVTGVIRTFTTLPLVLPSGTTGAATNVIASSVSISSSVNPNGSVTSAWFEWGQDPNLFTYNTDGIRYIGDGINPVNVLHNLSGLEETTTYFYRGAASSVAGTWKGSILSFTTPIKPFVVTQPATLVEYSGGKMNGAVDNYGSSSTIYFLWGTDPSLGYSIMTTASSIAGGVGLQPFSKSISGVAPSTNYYFRAHASTSTGNGQGTILSFTTHPATTSSFWSRTYGGRGHEKATALIKTGDGGFAVAGWTWSFDNIWLIKLTGNGIIQWQKSYGGFLYSTVIDHMRETSDGGYVLAGQALDYDERSADYWILRLDGDGEILWQRTYGESGSDVVQAVQQTSDGGFVAAGYTRSFGAGDLDVWVLKLDANGDVQWQKTYGTSAIEFAYSIEEVTSGFIVGALSRSDIGVLVMKLGSDGTLEWSKSYGDFEATTLTKTEDGGYILGGYIPRSGNNIVIKIESDGFLQWQRSYNGGGSITSITSIALADSGGYLAAGYTDSFSYPYDAFVLKLDNIGDVQWQKAYGGNGEDRANAVQENDDGSIIVAGYTHSFGVGQSDFWVLKLTDEGSCPPLDRDVTFSVQSISNTAVDAIITVTDSNLVYQDTAATATDTFAITMQQAP